MELPVEYAKLSWQGRKLVRGEYIRKQKGLCHYCGAPLWGPPSDKVAKLKVNTKWFPENFFEHPVHLHHSHDTGLTIGAVHCYCNAVLWEYEGE